MKNFINAIEGLPFIVKVILCIPFLDVIWCITRLFRSIEKKNVIGIILAALTIVPGAFFIWIIDLVCILINGKIWWFD